MANKQQYEEALEIVFSSATSGALLDQLVKHWQGIVRWGKKNNEPAWAMDSYKHELRKAKALQAYYKKHVGYNTWSD